VLGSNLPKFRDKQIQFAAHIRNPDVNERPSDVEARRMQIYLDLFFNNIQSFLASAFPVCKTLLGEDKWLRLVREFVHLHPSESPYFLQISEEFLTFLDHRGLADLPDFMLELCHYEWVELCLDVASDEVESSLPQYTADTDLMGRLVPNPHARALTYRYAVQEIGPKHQPKAAPENPTYLVVYRTRGLDVRFLVSNPVTHRLLELLDAHPAADAYDLIHKELVAAGREVSLESVRAQGANIVRSLVDKGILLGERVEKNA